jgi:hypothetical protein
LLLGEFTNAKLHEKYPHSMKELVLMRQVMPPALAVDNGATFLQFLAKLLNYFLSPQVLQSHEEDSIAYNFCVVTKICCMEQFLNPMLHSIISEVNLKVIVSEMLGIVTLFAFIDFF